MNRHVLSITLAAALLLPLPALADRERPPADALAASEVLRQVEQRPDFAALYEMEWDDDGYWEIEYWSRQGARRLIRLDPRSGAPRGR